MNNETPPADKTSSNIVVLPSPAPEPKPSEKVIAFVKRHPLITVAGGVAIGAATGLLLSRTARSKVAPPKLVNKATHLIEAASASSLLWGKHASKAAQEASGEAREKVYLLAEKASHSGLDKLDKLAKVAAVSAAAFGKFSKTQANRLGDIASDAAHKVGSAAADGSSKIADIAEDVREKVKSRN